MSLYVLDTDHVTLFQRAHPVVVQRVAAVEPEALAVTVVTAEEQLRGWLEAIRRASSGSKLVWAYAGLRVALGYFNSVHLLDFDQAAYTRYEELRRQKIRIGTQDLRIAAVVLSVEGILVTRNRRDFERVPALVLQDWTTP
ncbi:MAG: type II toxin-antitoxin system VapC family toxin [Anaerolineae bacterium]|nr:type II toxin-antitoxin system VapC family toxin [Anaerolineae bacterium]